MRYVANFLESLFKKDKKNNKSYHYMSEIYNELREIDDNFLSIFSTVSSKQNVTYDDGLFHLLFEAYS